MGRSPVAAVNSALVTAAMPADLPAFKAASNASSSFLRRVIVDRLHPRLWAICSSVRPIDARCSTVSRFRGFLSAIVSASRVRLMRRLYMVYMGMCRGVD